MPKISVIIPVYNCAQTLGKAIESAQRQTLRDIEIIIVDDCSTDNSYDVAQSFVSADNRVKCARLPQNGGASVARNTAIDMAAGEWIAVLDADDWYEPTRLEVMLKAARDLQADLICDNLKIYDHARQQIIDRTHHDQNGKPTPITAEMIFYNDTPLKRHAIGYVKPMVKKEFLQKFNIRNDPVHRAGQDFIFLAEIILNGARSFVIPDALYVYMHRISPTTRKISPTSRSDAGFLLIVRGCDELLQKYGASMTAGARHALKRKRWIFANRVECGRMLMALNQKRYGEAVRLLARHPFILVLIAVTLVKMGYANWLAFAQQTGLKRRIT